jgi:hypothetical protein
LLLFPHLILLLKHSPLLSIHLMLHEATGFAMELEAVGCWGDLLALWEMMLWVLLLLWLMKMEALLLMLWVCLRHRWLVHRVGTIRHANHRLVAKVLLTTHGSLHIEAIVSTKILRSSARRRAQLSQVLIKWCVWVCSWMRLRHLVAESTSVHGRQAVEVEVVNIEDVGKVVEVAAHGRHSVHVLWRL